MLASNYKTNISMKEILYILKVNKNDLESLEVYLQEYFERVMKKLKELNYQVLDDSKNLDQIDF